jgi:hypothetical protein
VLRCSGPKIHPMSMSTTPPIKRLVRPELHEANSKRAMMKSTADGSTTYADAVKGDANPGLDGLVDGACDVSSIQVSQHLFGLDGSWDDGKPEGKPRNKQHWGWAMTGSDAGEFKPMGQGQHASKRGRSNSHSSVHLPPTDDRAQSHVSQSGPAASPAIVINSKFISKDSITNANESVTHPAAGSQTDVRTTARSVARSNQTSRLQQGRAKPDEKGEKTSNDWEGEAWKVPLPSTKASNTDWTKPSHNSDTYSEGNWGGFDSKNDDKTADWVNSLSLENKDEGHNTGSGHGFWPKTSTSRARRNADNSQTRVKTDSWGEGKQWNQGPDRNTNNRDSTGNCGGFAGSANKDSGWNAGKTGNETNKHPSWAKEPKKTPPLASTSIPTAGGAAGHVSQKSPRLRSKSRLSQPFPGAWPRSTTPSPPPQEQIHEWSSPHDAHMQSKTPTPPRQEQSHKWSSPHDAFMQSKTPTPPRQEQSHKWSAPQAAVELPQTQPVQPPWGGATSEGLPRPRARTDGEPSSRPGATGWPGLPPNIPAELLHRPGDQIRTTPPASVPARPKVSMSGSRSRLDSKSRVRSASKATSKSRVTAKSMPRTRANTLASHGRPSSSPVNVLIPELKDSKDIRPVFDPNATDSPLYTIPEGVVKRKNVTHQMNAGRPQAYFHKLCVPKYMDSHDDPYAVFLFRYRSKGKCDFNLFVRMLTLE